MREQVEQILEEKVRPQLALHNGGIELLSVEGDTVRVRLLGQCSNCPASYLTTEELILGEISEKIPEIKQVIAVQGVSDELMAQARELLHRKHEEK